MGYGIRVVGLGRGRAERLSIEGYWFLGDGGEGEADGFFGGGGFVEVGFDFSISGELPGLEAEDGFTGAEGEGDFGERAVFAADGDHGLGGADDEDVPGFAEAGGEGESDVGVGIGAVESGEDGEGEAAGLVGAFGGGLHDAAESAGDEGGAGLGEEATGFFGEGGDFGAAGSGSDDGDDFLHGSGFRMLWGQG